MKPIVKYQGGKTRELSLIKEMLPQGFTRVVEPFCGGSAVAFGLGYPALLTDINKNIINLYDVVSAGEYQKLQNAVDHLKTLDHNALEPIYYTSRDIINSDTSVHSKYERARAYIVVRQLCFSGMERYNAQGIFNVPFGHYQKFACNLSQEHHNFLKKCTFNIGSFVYTFPEITSDDFAFIDPPYLDRLGYSENDGGIELHKELHTHVVNTTSKWMIVHSDHEFYREMYKDFNFITKDFGYAQRFGKNKNHLNAKVKHLYITNY